MDLLAQVGVPVRLVYFTHGDKRVEQQDRCRSVSLGKAWLVSRPQALLQTGRILLPKTEEAQVLARELLDFEIRVSEDANERYGAFRVGTHDDLVAAPGRGRLRGLAHDVGLGAERGALRRRVHGRPCPGGPGDP